VFLIKETGHLNEDGANVRFIGHVLQRTGDGILIYDDLAYFTQILKGFYLIGCKETSTPATSTTVITQDSEESLNPEQHSQYRRIVGKLQWEALVRPDCAFSIKELARYLN
jgi:hypothetical protein